jgi:cell wall-associated NlpC family hydrolase
MTEITRDMIVAEARTMLGCRYRHQGRNPAIALDCVGFVMAVANALGIPYQDVSGYSRRPDGTLIPALEAQTLPVDGAPLAGHIAVFHWNGEPMHLGIMTAPDRVIHAFAVNRCVCEHRLDAKWMRQLRMFRRFPGVED